MLQIISDENSTFKDLSKDSHYKFKQGFIHPLIFFMSGCCVIYEATKKVTESVS